MKPKFFPSPGDTCIRKKIGIVPEMTVTVTHRWCYDGNAFGGWKFHVKDANGKIWHADISDLRPLPEKVIT